MTYSQALAERVRAMLADQPSLTEKEVFGGLAFLLAGNMCVGVHAEDLIVRVGPPGRTRCSGSQTRNRSTSAGWAG